jgi:hypothetical protein
MLDLFKAETIEITLTRSADGPRVWIHADGTLAMRAYRVGKVVLKDDRDDPLMTVYA